MLTHGNLMFATRNALRTMAMMGPARPHARHHGHAAREHVGPSGAAPVDRRGSSVIVLDRFDPSRILDVIEAHRVNMISGRRRCTASSGTRARRAATCRRSSRSAAAATTSTSSS
jgi:hypothetical protein